jgi:hypothetical protein
VKFCFIYVYLRGPGHGQISPVTVTVPLTYAYILVLLSHVRRAQSDLFTSSFQVKILYGLVITTIYAPFTADHILLRLITPINQCRKLPNGQLLAQFSEGSCCFLISHVILP